jgi:hypothetical protein
MGEMCVVLKDGTAIPFVRRQVIDKLPGDTDTSLIQIFQTGDKP